MKEISVAVLLVPGPYNKHLKSIWHFLNVQVFN